MTANSASNPDATQTLYIYGSNFTSGNVVQFYWTQGSNAYNWNNSKSTPTITSTLITIPMDPGPVADTIKVRVCESASQTTASTCSLGTQAVTVITSSSAQAPTATTSAATSVSSTGGTFNGTVNPNGLSTSVWFQWGTTTALGQSTSPGTFTGTTAIPVNSTLSGASPNTTYYFRVAGQNSAGTAYGSTLNFTTSR
jgi:hypothetical protein